MDLGLPCRLLYSFSKFENDLDCLNLRRKKLKKKVDLFNFSFLMLAMIGTILVSLFTLGWW